MPARTVRRGRHPGRVPLPQRHAGGHGSLAEPVPGLSNQAMLRLVGKGRGGGGLGLSSELEGHAALAPALRQVLAAVAAQRDPAVQRDPGVQRQPRITTVSPMVIFRDPTVVRRPAREIATRHNQADAVGWTTPRYDLTVPSITRSSIEVRTVLNWTIELDSGMNDHRLDVLRDHEEGHVTIGKTAAREHFADGLTESLSALSSFSDRATVQGAIDRAGRGFEEAEGRQSRAYDSIDYPRMVAAYEGARLSYRQLVTRYPRIGALARALDRLTALGGLRRRGAAAVNGRAQAVIDALDALGPGLLARAQYSSALAGIVARARAVAVGMSGDPETADVLAELEVALGELKWDASRVVGSP